MYYTHIGNHRFCNF